MHTQSIIKRFENKFQTGNKDSCWIWESARGKYGFFWLNKKNVYAHRFSYEIYIGKIKDGLYVCHSCDNTLCVNPNHLWLGTAKDNAQDMSKKNRCKKQNGELNRMSKLKEKDVLKIKKYLRDGLFHREIAKKFNIGEGAISKIFRGETWASLSI